jgi:hypothetical protein
MSKMTGKLNAGRATKALLDPVGLFTEINDTPQAPAVTPDATVMPDPDGAAVKAARRRKLAAMQVRGGRESTILGGETRLGGD